MPPSIMIASTPLIPPHCDATSSMSVPFIIEHGGGCELPASAWIRVMQHLDSTRLLRLGRTCRLLHRCTQDPRVWRHVGAIPLLLQCPPVRRHALLSRCSGGNSGAAKPQHAAHVLASDVAASSVAAAVVATPPLTSLRSLPFPALLLLPSTARWSLRWSGSHVRSPTGVALLLAMPKAVIAHLRIEMTTADCSALCISHGDGGSDDSNSGGLSPLSSYTMPWSLLCSSDALVGLDHLALGEGCRDIHTLFPSASSAPSPLTLLPALTSLDLSALALYGNLLRGLPALTQLRALRVHDGDWGMQSARLCVGMPSSPRVPVTRLEVLSQCRNLTSLHVRLPFLQGARFAACFSEHAPLSRSLRHLSIDGFDGASTGWPARVDRPRLEGEPEPAKAEGARSDPHAAPAVTADFAAAFTALVVLHSLTLRSVFGIDCMLAGIPCAPLLRTLRVRAGDAPPPSPHALKELARLAPKLRVSVSGAEGSPHEDEYDDEEGGHAAW